MVHEVKQKLQRCHELARANLMKSKQRRVAQQASNVHMPVFKKGDKVLLRNEKAGKLDSFWAGPYTIYEIDPNGCTVIIEFSNKKVKVHVNRLKVYQSRGE